MNASPGTESPGTESTGTESPGTESATAVYRELARDGFVTLYWHPPVLEGVVDRLLRAGFAVVRLDASGWRTEDDLHDDVAAALDFPNYYGRNLDALNDCLRDVMSGEYGVPSGAAGVAFVFTHYDAFVRACPREAHVVLDILADHARRASVLGGPRTLCLVHSDDPDLAPAPVGAQPVQWNPREWLHSVRHPEAGEGRR
ncbi:hypothetical protein ABH931_004790 [Streptacidiphilus sp. MAP12-33]|uniref:barstar family protein n=1 Tax=Streptacidiphilus sp. MAP12-33 TaxID=3156266 RepID=UPI0035178903